MSKAKDTTIPAGYRLVCANTFLGEVFEAQARLPADLQISWAGILRGGRVICRNTLQADRKAKR